MMMFQLEILWLLQEQGFKIEPRKPKKYQSQDELQNRQQNYQRRQQGLQKETNNRKTQDVVKLDMQWYKLNVFVICLKKNFIFMT